MFDIAVACLVITALAAWINVRFIRLPTTIGVMVIAMLLSLLLLGANSFGFGALYDYEKRFLQAIDFTDVFKGFDDLVPALLAVLLSSLIVSVGFMLCFLPGLLVMGLVPTAAYLVAVGEKDGINAIRRAFEAIKANHLGTVVCSLVLSIVGSLGAIFCGIGAFLTLPIAFIGFYHMARQITDGGPLAITRA